MVTASLDTRRAIAATLAQAWAPRKRWRTADWCGEHFRVARDETGIIAPRFDRQAYKFLDGILDAFDDPEVETGAYKKAAQVGGTTLTHAIIASRPAVDPCPMLWVGPNQQYVREKRDLFFASAEKSGGGLPGRLEPRALRNDRRIHLGNCVCYLGWSGSSQTLSGRACRIVLKSEVDRWLDDAQLGQSSKLADERVKSFPFSSFIFAESTPSDETSVIDALFQAGDQRHWFVPCPFCNWFQRLRFYVHRDGEFAGRGGLAGVRDDHGNAVDPERARCEGYYLCEQGCRITNEYKFQMTLDGVWVPKGQSVDGSGKLTGTPDRPPRHASWTNSSLDVGSISFGRAAEEMVKAERDHSLRELWNNWIGDAYRARGRTPRWSVLGRRLACVYYSKGMVPHGAYFLTFGCDVQGNRAYYVVRAWGVQKTSWLVDWGVVRRSGETGAEVDEEVVSPVLASDLAELDNRLLDSTWPVVGGENPWGQTELPAALGGADSQYRTFATLSWARHPARRGVLLLTAGVPALDKTGESYRLQELDRNSRTGKPYPGGLQRWGLATGTYKEEIQERWSIEPTAEGAWLLPSNILQAGDDYLRQVTNERLIVGVDKKGRRTKEWSIISSAFGNHYLDCEMIAMAMADMAVGKDWTKDNLDYLASQRIAVEAEQPMEQVPPRAPLPEEDFSAR